MPTRYSDPYSSYTDPYADAATPRYRQPATTTPTAPAPATTPSQPAPSPFDASQQVGHNGTTSGGLTREQYRDLWQSSGAKSMQDLQNFVNQYGGKIVSDNGTVMTPYGEQIDMLVGAHSSTPTAGWGGVGDSGGSGSGSAGAGAGAGSGNGSGSGSYNLDYSSTPGNPGNGSSQGDALRQQLIQQLLQRSQQSLDVTANDPTIRAQAEPYAAAQERAARNYIADQAEASGPNANLAGLSRVAQEQAAQASGQQVAGLIGNEITQRRTEIQAALSGMAGYISDEDKIALQRELGYLDAATQRLGIQAQSDSSHYASDVSRQNALTAADTQRYSANLGNDQFYANLGLTADDRNAYWQAVNSGLIPG